MLCPVQVNAALFSIGDPRISQDDDNMCDTAIDATF